MRRDPRPAFAALLLALPMLAHAGIQVTVDGVDDNLKNAVINAVELSQYATRAVTEAQVRRLYDKANTQASTALQPYGYYDASVHGELRQSGNDWQVKLHITPGGPVKITRVNLSLPAPAADLRPIAQAMRNLRKLVDQTLNDGAYDAARDAISGSFTANGFLDAKLTTHKVEVNRAQHSAVITLAWEPGQRYRYGRIVFDGAQFRAGFLDRYLPFHSGDYFQQDQLLQLQQALNGADYFSVVNVQPDVDNAHDGVVDIKVQLAPAKRTIYTGGPFYGTDTGPGVRAGIEKRWVNDRGNKWKNDLVLAQRLKTLSTLYTVPMPGLNQRSFNYGATYRDADTPTSQSRTLELIANETRLWHGWTRQLGVHALDGTFTVGKRGDEPDNTPGLDHGRSHEVFAQASLARKKADNTNFVRNGWSLTLTASSTAGTLLSSARFSQLMADGKWIRAFWGNNRLILRGTLGTTWTDDFSALPPQLRFFAGGAQSIRGYGFQQVGPENSYGRVIGGRNLAIGSSEVEHYFTRNWGIATFVDAGNAFNGTDFKAKIGTGLGLRWRSPVGMIRLDLGVPVHDNRYHGIELGVVIGPDL